MIDDGGSGYRKRFTSVAWWFRDRHTGKIVIAQFPNVPLWIFLATAGVGPFFSSEGSHLIGEGWQYTLGANQRPSPHRTADSAGVARDPGAAP